MLQKIRTSIRKFVFLIINQLIKIGFFRKILNSIYNSLSWQNRRIVQRHIIYPKKNFIWKIKLLNKKSLKMYVSKNNPYTFQLALLYYNISPQICILENDINNYLPIRTPYFDIGAHQGMRSLLFLSSKRKTFMFEPNNYLNKINQNRCKLNNFQNYYIEQACVSNENGTQKFYFSKESSMSSLDINYAKKRGISKQEDVKTITIDYFFKNKRIMHKFPYIKVDVEGYEINVIQGAEKTIQNMRPTFLIEIFEKSHKKILFEYFFLKKYNIFGVNFGSENILTFISDIKSIIKCKASDYLFVYDEGLKNILYNKYIKNS